VSGSRAWPNPAVVVLIAAQGIDDPAGRLAEEAGGEQPPFQQPRLVKQEAVCRRERIIHSPTIRWPTARLS
jgi:hypothetical protein